MTDRVLVLLHGYEDEPDTRLAPRDLDAAWRVVEPRGPVELADGPAWFATDDDGPVEADVVHSLDLLDQTLAGLGDASVVLAGSSQGGVLALAHALTSSIPLAGVACVNGWLQSLESVTYDPARLAAAGVPVLVVGSAGDEVVPIQAARSAARYLERAGVEITWVESPGGHAVGPDVLAALATWLQTSIR